jgi:hypothetical protein
LSSKTLICLLIAFLGISFVILGQELPPTRVVCGSDGVACFDSQIQSGGRIGEVANLFRERGAVQLVYELSGGGTFIGPGHGYNGGRLNAIHLDSDEYVTDISGR